MATWTNLTKPSSGNEFLLLETGDFMLLETGDKIILDQSGGTGTIWTNQTKN
jgi:hypothetical protein